MGEAGGHPALEISDLHVYYGESHAIQGVSMTIGAGVLAVVGRNGMGKSTLCNTITGLKASRSGSIRIFGRETSRLEPHVIHRHGVGYVPQGTARLAEPVGRRAPAAGRRRRRECEVDGRPRLPDLSRGSTSGAASGGTQLVRRRAANAGDRARAARQSAPSGHGRADRRARTDHCRSGRSDAGEACRRTARWPILLVEQNIGVATAVVRQRRHHGQRPHQPRDGTARARRRSRIAAAASRRRQAGRRGQAPLPEQTAAGASAEELMAQVYRVERGERRRCHRSVRGTLRPSAPLARALEHAGERACGNRSSRRRGEQPKARGSLPSRSPNVSTAPPSSPAPSTPRAASSISSATGSRHSALPTRTVDLSTSRQALDRRRHAAPCREHASARQPRRFSPTIADAR